jgi:hypothetical protein
MLHFEIIEAKDKKIILYESFAFFPFKKRNTKNDNTIKTKNRTYKTPVFIPAA